MFSSMRELIYVSLTAELQRNYSWSWLKLDNLCVCVLKHNHFGLTGCREVLEKDAKDYADSIHAIFVETSAKNAININEVFIEISEYSLRLAQNKKTINEAHY